MLVLYGPAISPKSAAWRTRSATFALQISFLLGRQLMLGQEPPIHRRSTTAVRCPAPAMSQARSFPPAPLPRMRISYRSVGMVISLRRWYWLSKRRDHFRGEQLEMRLCPPRRQSRRQRPRVIVCNRDVADVLANHGYRRIGLDDFENAALSQVLAVGSAWCERRSQQRRAEATGDTHPR